MTAQHRRASGHHCGTNTPPLRCQPGVVGDPRHHPGSPLHHMPSNLESLLSRSALWCSSLVHLVVGKCLGGLMSWLTGRVWLGYRVQMAGLSQPSHVVFAVLS